ncbi:MAG: helix-turn-helix transcriptional regulator [Robiginitomaculum sp.]|nr:helix-turn-helix transcriptional regulator [Robiginitomaculum sp.]
MKARTAVIAFDSLSHSGRLKIFRKLIKRGKSGLGASELCKIMNIPPATLSFHMSKLINGDLVTSSKKGKFITYRANPKQVTRIINFLMDKCYLEEENKTAA